MKGFIITLIVLLLVVVGGVAITTVYYINPGNVGVLIYKSGQNSKGVSDTPITPGWGFRKLFTEDVTEYPVFQQTAIWTKSITEGSTQDDSISANSKEGSPVNMDVSVSYTLEAAKVPDLYVKYRSDIGTIQTTYLRQTVRQAIQDTFGQYAVDEIYGPKKQEVVGKIQGLLTEKLSKDGFNITQFTINEIRFPQNIIDSINQKITASQDVLTAQQNLQKADVDAKTRIAQATGEAEAIKIQAQSISNQGGANYVNLKAIEKWNGQLPTTMLPGGSLPFVNVH